MSLQVTLPLILTLRTRILHNYRAGESRSQLDFNGSLGFSRGFAHTPIPPYTWIPGKNNVVATSVEKRHHPNFAEGKKSASRLHFQLQ